MAWQQCEKAWAYVNSLEELRTEKRKQNSNCLPAHLYGDRTLTMSHVPWACSMVAGEVVTQEEEEDFSVLYLKTAGEHVPSLLLLLVWGRLPLQGGRTEVPRAGPGGNTPPPCAQGRACTLPFFFLPLGQTDSGRGM